jgi:DNA-binding Lrp family transcriptional regulator
MTARSSGHKWPRSRYPLVIALSRPLPVSVSPFRPLARRLGLTPEALLKEVRIFQEAGVIRRAGFVVDHNAVGIKANALAAWNVRPGDLDRAGRCFASFPEVSHCYARRAYPHWPYNLYTMLHSRSGRARGDLVRAMASCPGITEYRVLTTLKEYKKTKADLASLFA